MAFKSISDEQKNSFVEGILSLEKFMKESLDIDSFLIYGTLLGAIREKDFIAHDHDIDIAYLSKEKTTDKVLIELDKIRKVFKSKNLLAKSFVNSGQTHIYFPKGHRISDLWASWINKEGKWCLSACMGLYWIVGDKSILLPIKKIKFRTVMINVPNNSIKCLELTYNNWERVLEENYGKMVKKLKMRGKNG